MQKVPARSPSPNDVSLSQNRQHSVQIEPPIPHFSASPSGPTAGYETRPHEDATGTRDSCPAQKRPKKGPLLSLTLTSNCLRTQQLRPSETDKYNSTSTLALHRRPIPQQQLQSPTPLKPVLLSGRPPSTMPASGPVPLGVAPRAPRPPAHSSTTTTTPLDEPSHSNLRPLSALPVQRPSSVPPIPPPPPPLASNPKLKTSHSIDMAQEGDLLKSTSLYLDGQYSKSSAFEDGLDSEVLPVEPECPPEVLDVKGKKKTTRASKAERLAAEQAVWVRDKFDLPQDENLIATFSAALVRHILLQGRIYITSSGICFYAKIFGRITKEQFPFASIARVKKRRGGFVANAIKIYFIDEAITPVVIASLNHRERACKIIQERLREVNPAAAESRDGDDAGSAASAGPDSEDKSLDEDEYNANGLVISNQQSGDAPNQNTSKSGKANGLSQMRNSVNIRPPESDSMSEMSSRKSSDIDQISRVEPNVPQEPTPQLVWRTNSDVMDRVSGREYEKKTERARGVFDAPVIEAFNILFISDWLKQYHEASDNRDCTVTDWYRGSDGFMTRDVTFRKPLGYKIGPKETRVKERQRYSFTKEGGVIVELEGQNLDAPYGDYFVVESFFELSPHEGGAKTEMVASIAIHFNKSTILRGKIESGALAETKIAFQRVIDLASKRIAEHVASKCQPSRALPPLPRKRQEKSAMEVTPPSFPSTKQRSEDVAVPADTCTMQGAIPSMVPAAAINIMDTPGVPVATNKTVTANIEVRDSLHTKWLKVLALGALVLACFLLLAVMILLYKMQSNITMLEKLVHERHADMLGKCAEKACSAGADVLSST